MFFLESLLMKNLTYNLVPTSEKLFFKFLNNNPEQGKTTDNSGEISKSILYLN